MGRKKANGTGEEATGAEEASKTRAPRVRRTLSQQLTELHAAKLKEVQRLRARESDLAVQLGAVKTARVDAEKELGQLASAAGLSAGVAIAEARADA